MLCRGQGRSRDAKCPQCGATGIPSFATLAEATQLAAKVFGSSEDIRFEEKEKPQEPIAEWGRLVHGGKDETKGLSEEGWAIIRKTDADFPGFEGRCLAVKNGARSIKTFVLDDAIAFAQCQYLSEGEDGMHNPRSEPALGFFVDVLCFDGIDAIRRFAKENGLGLSTARAVLAGSIDYMMRNIILDDENTFVPIDIDGI